MRNNNKKRHGLFFGITSRFLMLCAAGLLVLSYLSLIINPAKAWFMTIFGLGFGLFLLLNLGLLVWAIMRRSRAALIPLIAIIPALFMVGRYWQRHSDGALDTGIKVLSYNVGRFSIGYGEHGKLSNRECMDSILTFLKEQNADIICLQEFKINPTTDVKSYLSRYFKGCDIEYYLYTGKSGRYGNVTISRYPAVSKGKICFEGSANLAIYSDYTISGELFRVYNCHFQSYGISLPRIISSMKKDYRKALKDTEDRVRMSVVKRPRQVDQVMKDIEACKLNSIVAGDFNDTPMSYTYNRLKHGRKDSFIEAGHGSGSTFSKLGPFLRIDYVLVPEDVSVLKHNVLKIKYSDHYPILTEIKI